MAASKTKGFYHDETYKTVCCWTAATRIKYVANPKKGKSFIRYAGYEKAKTVGESLAKGSFPIDLLFDFQTGKLSVIGGAGGAVRKEPVDPSKAETQTDKMLSKWYYRSHPAKLQALRDAEKVFQEKGLGKMNQLSQSKALDLSTRLGIKLEEFSEGMLSPLDAARKCADIEAKRILETATAKGKKITDQDCLKILEKWAFRKNEARLNVMPEGTNFVHSDTLGLIRARDGRYMATEPTNLYPNVFSLFNQWLQDSLPAGCNKPFPFTSISVNYAYAAKIHRDQGNCGPSFGAALGKFTGGRLNYWEQDNKSLDLDSLQADVAPKIMDVKQGPKLFDGRRAHSVEAFKGERFSLVFFSAGKYWKTPQKVQSFLSSCRCKFPAEKSMEYYNGKLPTATGYDKVDKAAGSKKRLMKDKAVTTGHNKPSIAEVTGMLCNTNGF
ncbi:unnamed protein product [Polarella glacialis]|uniref:Uncharacterized protein n=1 Tax=Polarella glacialis TaxID=89957 RepID=A0A813K232_POLGL|nr:unnamed protein product [Polarella glacialis]